MDRNMLRIQGKGVSERIPNYVNYFQEASVLEDMTIPAQKPNIEDLLDVTVACDVIDYNLVETTSGKSYEGQQLSGQKLIVSIMFKLQIKYVAESCSQTIHAAHSNELIKNVFVVVPTTHNGDRICDLIRRNKFSINCYVEDIYAVKKDNRTISNFITYLVDVKFF